MQRIHKKIGFIGGGNMACAIISGLISSETISQDNLFAFAPSESSKTKLRKNWGISIASSNQQLIEQCDIVLLCVKPQQMKAVLLELDFTCATKSICLISVAAGITIDQISRWTHPKQDKRLAILRAMPNTPSLLGAGMSGLYANNVTTQEKKINAEQIFSSVGQYAWLDSETDINLITALSGSGPAYFMQFTEHLINAACKAGIDEEIARKAAIATATGSAKLMSQSSDNLKQLIKNVTSPGGTTEKALQSFANDKLENTVNNAFCAANQRAKELSQK